MKVLVTGPDGVLGSNLLRELLSQGYDVTAMTEDGKKSPTIDDLPINKIGGNLLNEAEIIKATEGMDVVIHCAASTNMFPGRSEIVNKVNIGGTENIIKGCKVNGVKRLIYCGTANSFASGDMDNLGSEKNDYAAWHYKLDYMDSKYKAQLVVLKAVAEDDLDAVVVNPTFMIGPYDSRPSSGAMVIGVARGTVPGYTYGGKNFVAVKDVAVAITNAISKGVKGECYILGNENMTYKAAFDKIANTIGVKPPTRKLSSRVVKFIGRMNSFMATVFRYYPQLTKELAILSTEEHYYSPQKARDVLGLPSTPLEIAFKECYDWFIENDYLEKK